MPKSLLPIIFFLLAFIQSAQAYEVVVVKGGLSQPYGDMHFSFVHEFNKIVPPRGLKSIEEHRFYDFVMDDSRTDEELRSEIVQKRPDLIVALGNKALLAVRDISKIPILYMLVAGAEKIIDRRSNITGFNLTVSSEIQFAEIKKILPRIKRVGIIFDPRYSGSLLEDAFRNVSGFEFISRSADNPKDVPRLLETLKDRVDLLWLIPDRTVTNPQTIASYFQFSFTNNVPVLAFSEKYLNPGAAIVVGFDLDKMGQATAQRASDILAGKPLRDFPVVSAPPHKTIINDIVSRKLKLPISRAEQ